MIRTYNPITLIALVFLLNACSQKEQKQGAKYTEKPMISKDSHSYARPTEAVVKHLDLDITVHFDEQSISGIASYTIEHKPEVTEIYFDTEQLSIEKVTLDDNNEETDFSLAERDEILGQALVINIRPETKSVHIHYHTNPGARALQWLNPQQTAGKKSPFLFTQSQAILARTWLPCQDSPGIRYTYSAKVKVPEGMLALMSAVNPTEKNAEGHYEFRMDQPVPSYLMALAVGDIVFEPIGEHTGVYAEPAMLEASVHEFAEMEDMLLAAEKLYGTYAWERYDLIVLPPSFPFGGMENPRLTFATPTIIAGDRSLTALVAHELAHSWSGNLVTNATWDDFWLNEGFTVYFEQRIMEALYGRDYSEMLAVLSRQGLEHEVKELLAKKPEDTHLKLDLSGRDPDDGMTAIAYDKGYFFLRLLEETVGREAFDAFLKNYFEEHRFQVMNTKRFLEKLKKDLLNPEQAQQVTIDAWVYGPGLPENCPVPRSERFTLVDEALSKWKAGAAAADLEVQNWTTHEWLHFLRALPETLSPEQMTELDAAFAFTRSGNNEILAAWWQPVIKSAYQPAYEAMKNFLIQVGRRKFLTPTYRALKAHNQLDLARSIYKEARPNYHSVSTGTMDELLGWNEHE